MCSEEGNGCRGVEKSVWACEGKALSASGIIMKYCIKHNNNYGQFECFHMQTLLQLLVTVVLNPSTPLLLSKRRAYRFLTALASVAVVVQLSVMMRSTASWERFRVYDCRCRKETVKFYGEETVLSIHRNSFNYYNYYNN